MAFNRENKTAQVGQCYAEEATKSSNAALASGHALKSSSALSDQPPAGMETLIRLENVLDQATMVSRKTNNLTEHLTGPSAPSVSSERDIPSDCVRDKMVDLIARISSQLDDIETNVDHLTNNF